MIPKNNDMRFEVTTCCNYNCMICPREKLTRKKETMSLELFKELLDKIMAETDQYDTLSFPGFGEPLVDSTLVEKIEYANKKYPKLQKLLLTNGSIMDLDYFERLQAAGLDSVRVSLYGHDANSYSYVHGIDDLEQYYKVKENLLDICNNKKTTDVLLTYNLVEGQNEEDLDEWIGFWKDKVDLLEVWKPHNWVDGRDFRHVQSDMNITCGRPFSGPLQIQVDGTVNMCCFDFDGKLTLGDLKTQSLFEIFEAEAFNKIKDAHTSGNYEGTNLICEHCDQRNKDKSDVAIFNSKFDTNERVNMVSTTYNKVI